MVVEVSQNVSPTEQTRLDDEAAKAARLEAAKLEMAEQARDDLEQRRATRRLRAFVRRVNTLVPPVPEQVHGRAMCARWDDHLRADTISADQLATGSITAHKVTDADGRPA